MAHKKSDRKSKNISKPTRKGGEAVGFQNIISDERVDFILGLILFVVSIVLLWAMFSYLGTSAADQSILERMRPGEWMNSSKEFSNTCGSFGAILSYYLISVNFGLPSFLIPIFFILVSLKLMRVYKKINLWKWFLCLSVTMIWSSVTFAKFLAPILGDEVWNPGGGIGALSVQYLENLVGAPGLTAILILTAIIFLTYLTSETITFVRKCLNPVGIIRNKVKFTITNPNEPSTDDATLTDNTLYGDNESEQHDTEQEEQEEVASATDVKPEDLKPVVIDLDQLEKENQAKQTREQGAEEVTPTEPERPTFLQQQRENRMAEAIHPAADLGGMEVSVAHEEEKSTSNTVSDDIDLSTPINPREPFTRYHFPTLDLLKSYPDDDAPVIDEQEQIANKNRIIEVLGNFGVQIKTIKATIGPTITLYEIQPAEGVRISRIKNLEDDIALSLAALGIRIIAPIPGKGTIGIEVPNAKPHIVSMKSILDSKKFQETKMELPVALGKTITNEVFMFDLAKVPHLLVAGATGQGKSVGLNAIITSLLYKKHPNELKFVLIDPKKVEFSIYTKIAPHFMAVVDPDDEPIITDVTKVVRTLNSLCALMDHRYDMLKMAGARNIKEYNRKFVNHQLDLTKGHEYMPYIVVVIDEFGDLIMTAGKEIELPIARIAQLARAVGIHMVIATQRPTTSIITGNIKANFPGRIAFKVSAGIDSKTILDRTGAQQLIGRGDMLYLNGNEPVRVQCAFVDTPEVEAINNYIADQPGPVEPLILPEPVDPNGNGNNGNGNMDVRNLDPFFEEAAHAIVLSQQGSTSMIQRRFSIGYNRAGRLMDQMEEAGIVGPAQGSKPREVLIQDENQLNQLIAQIRG